MAKPAGERTGKGAWRPGAVVRRFRPSQGRTPRVRLFVAFVADLLSVNRRLNEDIHFRLHGESPLKLNAATKERSAIGAEKVSGYKL